MKYLPAVLILISTCLILYGCDPSKVPKEYFNDETKIKTIAIKGVPIDCIQDAYRLSCNWERYNQMVRRSTR